MSQNAKNSEIEHFNSQASFWWDENGPLRTLHHINPARLEYVMQFIDLKGKKVLDVGCGAGVLSEALAKAGAEVTAIDLAQEAIEVGKLHLYESGLKINYLVQSVEDFASENNEAFDVVVCMELLEHVPEPQSVVDSCSKVLKSEGMLFLSTLNRSAKSMMFGIFAAEHVLNLVPKGTHHYSQFIRPSELVAGVEKSGLQVIDICGMKYNPLSQNAWLDKCDVDINYLMTAKKK